MATCKRVVENNVITMDDTNLSDLTHEVEDDGDIIFCCIFLNV